MAGTRRDGAQPRRADGTPARVLLVDSERPLSQSLAVALRHDGWDVRVAPDGGSAMSAAKDFRPDLVLLDVRLPDMDGLEVLRRLRTHTEGRIPALFLAAQAGLPARIAGLTGVGDDFITKPFTADALLRRVQALWAGARTHAAATAAASTITVGDLTLDEDQHHASRSGQQIQLTATEYELLRFLMHNRGRVLSKAQILDRVWDYDFGGHANIVELYISYLRKKIDAGRAQMIHTVRGFGYVLRAAL